MKCVSRAIQRSVTASVGRQFLLPAAAAMASTLHPEHMRPEHMHPARDRSADIHMIFCYFLLLFTMNYIFVHEIKS